MSKKKLLRILISLCLGLVITSCRVIPTTPDCPPCPTADLLQSEANGNGGGDSTAIPASDCLPAQPAVSSLPVPKTALVTADIPLPGFVPQIGSPAYISSFFPLACSWQGVGGQVFDLYGNPLPNMVITVGGWLNGSPIDKVSLSGTSPAFGPGGYEIHLASQPYTSMNSLWIQVSDLSGQIRSEAYQFDTYADCERNLIIINFIQNAPFKLYLGTIMSDGSQAP